MKHLGLWIALLVMVVFLGMVIRVMVATPQGVLWKFFHRDDTEQKP